MSLDAALIKATANELKETLLGARVDKLYSPTRDEIVINLRTEARKTVSLFISARSGSARIHITKETFENPLVPPAFCMLLRKHLSTGKIIDIYAKDGERICFVVFSAVNEMGDKTEVTLSVELMGRYSNLVIIDKDNKIIDALKRVDIDQSEKRQLGPGIMFTMPPKQQKLPFLLTDTEQIVKSVIEKNKPLSSAIMDTTSGVAPLIAREISYVVSKQELDADQLTAEQKQTLVQVIDNVKIAASGTKAKFSILYDKERPFEFSFFDINQYGDGCTKRYFETASEMFDLYFAEKDRIERSRNKSHDLKKQVSTLIDRTVRRQQAREEELDSADKAETKKLYGELLTANISNINPREKTAKVLNYYTGEYITIPLDPMLSPNANAQKYYKDYRKLVTAKKVLSDLIETGKGEIEYLKSVLYEIEQATTEQEYLNIRRELKEAGFLKSFKMPNKKQLKTVDYIEYQTSGGYRVLVGKNNLANEKLTFKTAAKSDIWFHVKNAPGSHVVLFSENTEPSEQDYTEAAMIAAFYSSEKGGEMVAVDYTNIKNIKKPPSAKLGMVIYHTNFSAYVTVDEQLLERLRS